jgi:hypothetical protein
MPSDAMNSTLVLCFARIERPQGTMIDAEVCYKLTVCMVFYTHLGDIRVPWLMPRYGINSTLALRFTRIERHQGTMIDADVRYKLTVCIVFYMHRATSGYCD